MGAPGIICDFFDIAQLEIREFFPYPSKKSHVMITGPKNLKAIVGMLRASMTAECFAGNYLWTVLQFHGGGFVVGSSDSASHDFFCRKI